MEIIGSIKNYQWGKFGLESEVAKLAKLNSLNFQENEKLPYSELWMGDHESGPSKIKLTGETLGDYIAKDKDKYIGGHHGLPFLFKVLSVRQALSIQVHPNKKEAERLHSKYPDIYKDSNHKPELAIALTPFQALCGFRPYKEIFDFCQQFPPLSVLIGEENVRKLQSNKSEDLKRCFSILMNSKQEDINECIGNIIKDYQTELTKSQLIKIFQTLNADFPNDVGILCLFFFNVVRLNAGEAIFLPANEPHAYLEGDCIECMACSDNVIRAGLTPKFKDIPTLLEMINYEGQSPDMKFFQPRKFDEFVDHFIPKIEDFAVAKISIPLKEKYYKMKNQKFGSILLVLSGKCTVKTTKFGETIVTRGSILFIPGDAGNHIEFLFTENGNEEFLAYQAMYNSYCNCDY